MLSVQRGLLLLLALGTYVAMTAAGAEIYSWVDEEGKRHFSDTPPMETEKEGAEVSRQEIELHNIDFGYPPGIVVDPDREERQGRHRQRTSAEAQQLNEACRKARADLDLLSGRVVFTGKDGKEIRVTESQRQAIEKSLRAAIRKECRD